MKTEFGLSDNNVDFYDDTLMDEKYLFRNYTKVTFGYRKSITQELNENGQEVKEWTYEGDKTTYKEFDWF